MKNKKIVSPFVWLKRHSNNHKRPNGWVMDYAVKGSRKIIMCYDNGELPAPILVLPRRDARLMLKALNKALKLNRKAKNVG